MNYQIFRILELDEVDGIGSDLVQYEPGLEYGSHIDNAIMAAVLWVQSAVRDEQWRAGLKK